MTIRLLVTDRIRDAIGDVLKLGDISEAVRSELVKWERCDDEVLKNDKSIAIEDIPAVKDSSAIPLITIEEVLKILKEAGRDIYLNELLEGSGLYVEPVEEAKKSPELVARLQKLQAKQDELRYRSMVKDIDRERVQKSKKEIAFEVRSTSRQLSSVVNFVLSVVGTFVFGYMSSQFAFANIGLRVIFGLILASIVALAELYFMARTEI